MQRLEQFPAYPELRGALRVIFWTERVDGLSSARSVQGAGGSGLRPDSYGLAAESC